MPNPILFSACGQEWEIQEVTPGVRKRLSAWCAARARQELFDQKADLSPEAYREANAILSEEIASGAYRWGCPFEKNVMGSGMRRMLFSEGAIEAQFKFLAVLLERKHPDVTPDEVARILADNPEAVSAALIEAIVGPNAPAPERPGTTASGGTESPGRATT